MGVFVAGYEDSSQFRSLAGEGYSFIRGEFIFGYRTQVLKFVENTYLEYEGDVMVSKNELMPPSGSVVWVHSSVSLRAYVELKKLYGVKVYDGVDGVIKVFEIQG